MQRRVGAMRQWGAALGEDPARRLHYDGRGTPPRPSPPTGPAFVNTPPGRFSSGIQSPHWSTQRGGQQLRDNLSYSGAPSMNSYAYAPTTGVTVPALVL